MAKATRQKTVGAVSELNPRIDKCIELQAQIDVLNASLSAERTCVKDIMESAKLDRYATARGNEALIIGQTTFTWNAAALEGELSEEEFDELCPRKPVGEKLRKRFDSDKDFAARVKKCFKRTAKSKLELRAKGAEQASENVTPIEDAA